MKKFYTVAIVLCICLFLAITKIQDDFYKYLFGFGEYPSYLPFLGAWAIGITGVLLALGAAIFFVIGYSLTFKRVKTSTAKVMSILGLCFAGLMILVSTLPFIELYAFELTYLCAYVFLTLMLAFSIVNLVQSVKYKSKQQAGAADIIDSI